MIKVAITKENVDKRCLALLNGTIMYSDKLIRAPNKIHLQMIHVEIKCLLLCCIAIVLIANTWQAHDAMSRAIRATRTSSAAKRTAAENARPDTTRCPPWNAQFQLIRTSINCCRLVKQCIPLPRTRTEQSSVPKLFSTRKHIQTDQKRKPTVKCGADTSKSWRANTCV